MKVGGVKVAVKQGEMILITKEEVLIAPVAFPNKSMVYEVPTRFISVVNIPTDRGEDGKVIDPSLIV